MRAVNSSRPPVEGQFQPQLFERHMTSLVAFGGGAVLSVVACDHRGPWVRKGPQLGNRGVRDPRLRSRLVLPDRDAIPEAQAAVSCQPQERNSGGWLAPEREPAGAELGGDAAQLSQRHNPAGQDRRHVNSAAGRGA